MTKSLELPVAYRHKYPQVQLFQDADYQILQYQAGKLPPQNQVFTQPWWQENGDITGSASGRGTTLFVRYDEQELILRQYLRGGLPGKVLSNQFLYLGLSSTRAWQEFFLLLDMLRFGLPVPEPVMAGITRNGFIYRNYILIKRIPGAVDLHQRLSQQPLDQAHWYQLGALVKSFHEKQVYHHDLNVRNVMLDKSDNFWLIDFDKCAIIVGEQWKAKNLARFRRSLVKEQSKTAAYHWQDSDWQHFMQGYMDNK